jgi:hypothetical protein
MSPTVLQALGNLGEFVSAICVVVSMVYLAREMQQNTRSVRAASFNSMVQNSIGLLEHSFRDGEFADFLHRAEQDPDALSPPEKLRWEAYMTAAYRHFGNLVYQYRVGAIDRQMWDSYERTLKEHLRVASWVTWFQANKVVFSISLVDTVERLSAELDAERAGQG